MVVSNIKKINVSLMENFLIVVDVYKVISKVAKDLSNVIAKMSAFFLFLVYTFIVDSAKTIINEDYFKGQTDYNPDARTKTSRMPLEEDIVGLVDFLEFGKVEIVNSQVIVVNRKISHS